MPDHAVTAAATPALSITDLQKTYDTGVHALKGVSLQVVPGDFFALLGPNGAGKSTLIGIVSSLVNKTAGEVEVFGVNLAKDRDGAMRLLGLVPQDEAQDLVTAAWSNREAECVLASVDGGRKVAAIRQSDGRWAACNAFPDEACSTRREAERRLLKLLKRGRKGTVGTMPAGIAN